MSPVLSPKLSRSIPSRRPTVSMALMLREMATTYGRSPLGYLWAILLPAAQIAVLAICFSIMMRSPPLGTNFVIFFATGMLPFRMWREMSGQLSTSITFSRQLLVYPSVTYLDAILARFLLNSLTNMLVFYVVIAGTILAFDTRFPRGWFEMTMKAVLTNG